MTRRLWIVVLLYACWMCVPSPAASQVNPADSARVLLAKATELKAWGAPEDAPAVLTLLRRAAELFAAARDREGELAALERLGRVHADAMTLDSALLYQRRAAAVAREIGNLAAEARTLENIGGIQWQTTHLDSALNYYTSAARIYATIGNAPASARIGARLQAVREARAVELLNTSPLLEPTMGVVAGARHVRETRAVLFGLSGFDPAGVTSVEEADEALEQVLAANTVFASVTSVPPGQVVKYRRILDALGQEQSVTTDRSIPLRPALYVFVAVDPQTGRSMEQRIPCATNCNVTFNFGPLR